MYNNKIFCVWINAIRLNKFEEKNKGMLSNKKNKYLSVSKKLKMHLKALRIIESHPNTKK